jgi:hypothetical protein
MKFVWIMFLCLFLGFNAFAQSELNQPSSADGVTVEAILLARDDGNGQAGDETDVFLTDDIPIYCAVQLNSMKPTTVKMNLIAVSVAGVKPETKVITVNYKTNGKQNRVNFTGKPDNLWTVGKYRIDVFIDGKMGGSREFKVQKSISPKTEDKIQTQPKPKSSLKPKIANRIRKN